MSASLVSPPPEQNLAFFGLFLLSSMAPLLPHHPFSCFLFHTKDLYDYVCVTGLVGEENGRNVFGARRLPARRRRAKWSLLRGVLSFFFLPHIGIEMIRTKSGSGSAGKRGEKKQEEGEKRELSKKNKVHLLSTGSVQMQMRSWVDPGKD
jgi:hypothetical protein